MAHRWSGCLSSLAIERQSAMTDNLTDEEMTDHDRPCESVCGFRPGMQLRVDCAGRKVNYRGASLLPIKSRDMGDLCANSVATRTSSCSCRKWCWC